MRRRNQLKSLAAGLVAAVVAASGAQAAQRPDDRAGPLGIGTASTAVTQVQPSVRPDDRAGPLGIGEPSTPVVSSAVRPDDRAGPLGIGAPSTPVVSPAVRPDDRPGIRGVGDVQLIPLSSGTGFDWGDASIGAATGFGLALALFGVALMTTRRPMGGHKTGTATAG